MRPTRTLINLNFDDGRVDTYTVAYPILSKYSLPATINITTGYIESGNDNIISDIKVAPMAINMLKELSLNPNIEIAGHGHWHKNSKEDIITGIRHLKQLIPFQLTWGFASPGTNLSYNYYKEIRKSLEEEGVSYVRLSLRYLSRHQLKKILRKVSRVIHIPAFYAYAYKDTLQDSISENILYSIPILSTITVNEIHAVIKRAIRENKTCILMFHSIVKNGKVRDIWDFDEYKFDNICRILSTYQEEGLLKVTTAKEIHKILASPN